MKGVGIEMYSGNGGVVTMTIVEAARTEGEVVFLLFADDVDGKRMEGAGTVCEHRKWLRMNKIIKVSLNMPLICPLQPNNITKMPTTQI